MSSVGPGKRGQQDGPSSAVLADLKESHANLEALIENTQDFILFADCEGRPLVFNSAYAGVMKELLGIDMAPGIKPHERLTDPAARAAWEGYHRRALSGERFTVEYSHPTAEGMRHFEVSYNPVRKGGEIIGFSEFTRDITERVQDKQRLEEAYANLERRVTERTSEIELANAALKQEVAERRRAEEALRESEARYRSLFEGAPMALVTWDSSGTVLDWNSAAEKTFGWSSTEAVGQSCMELLIPESTREEVQHLVQEMLVGDDVSRTVQSNLTKAGDTITCEWSSALFRDATGTVRGVVSAGLDITERLRMEERLRHSEKLEAVGQLAGGVAHDFNNQLAGIMGFASLLERSGDPTHQAWAQGILKSARRSSELVSQLLAFARKGKRSSEPIDLHELAFEVIRLLERSLDKNIEVATRFDASSATALGDATLLQNALLNLALNARDSMPEGGLVEFRTHIEPIGGEPSPASVRRKVVITIRDTGEGMSPEVRERIFEPFFTTKEQGTGMGLATVYGAIESHNGDICVDSTPGEGTTVTLRLPLHERSQADPEPPRTDTRRGPASRILVVDDEAMVRKLLTIMLGELGHEVVVFDRAADALEHYRRFSSEIDLIIFDMIMPEMDGAQFFTAVREINPKVKALLSSGYSVDPRAERLASSGDVDVLAKPYDLDTLTKKLRDLLR